MNVFIAQSSDLETRILDGLNEAGNAGTGVLSGLAVMVVLLIVYKVVSRTAKSVGNDNYSSKSETYSVRGTGVSHSSQRFRPGFGRGARSPSVRGKGIFGVFVGGLLLASGSAFGALEDHIMPGEPTYQWAVRSGLQTANTAGESVLAFAAIIVVTFIVWWFIVKFANYCSPESRQERAAYHKEMAYRDYSRAERLNKRVDFDLWKRVRDSWDSEDEW